jgi:hypothetical protein
VKRFNGFALGFLLCAASTFAADQTWTGQISDSTCGASHKAAIEHAGKNLSDADCTVACVKNGGKYVFVSGGKIYDIANQDLGDLEKHAGHTVKLTGEMKGNAITVHKIEMGGKS